MVGISHLTFRIEDRTADRLVRERRAQCFHLGPILFAKVEASRAKIDDFVPACS